MEPRVDNRIAVKIQNKFKPVIQGTWRQGKITLTYKLENMKIYFFTFILSI